MSSNEHTNKRAGAYEVSDIEKLAGTEEGVYLEFKKPSEFVKNSRFSRDEFTMQLTETVSAFLNSDGGVMLIGVQTDKQPKDKKIEFLKPLMMWVADQTFESLGIPLTASQIQDVINNNITPRPTGVEVKAVGVQIGDVVSKVFVVTVTRSPFGAHQSTKTMRYYRRTSDGDVPMLDFEIRDVNSRRAGPLLYLGCKLHKANGVPFEEEWKTSSIKMRIIDSKGISLYEVDLLFGTTNLGRGTANVAEFDIGIPISWQVQKYSPDGINVGAHWEPNSGLQHVIGNRVTVFWTPEKCPHIPLQYRNERLSEQEVAWQQVVYSGSQTPAHPIWPTADRVVIGVLRLQRQVSGNPSSWSWLPWKALSNEMLETRGAVLLKEYGGDLQVANYEMDEVSWCSQAEDNQKFEELKQRFKVS